MNMKWTRLLLALNRSGPVWYILFCVFTCTVSFALVRMRVLPESMAGLMIVLSLLIVLGLVCWVRGFARKECAAVRYSGCPKCLYALSRRCTQCPECGATSSWRDRLSYWRLNLGQKSKNAASSGTWHSFP